MIAEGAFPAALIDVHIAFQHDLAGGRNFKVNGHAFRQLHRLMAQEAGEDHFVDIAGQGRCRRVRHRRIRADGHRRLQAGHALRLGRPIVLRPILMNVPVHPRSGRVVFLQPVHAHIALICLGIFRKDQRQRHEGAAVLRPAFQNRQDIQRRMVLFDHFLTGGVAHIFGEIDGLPRHRNEGNKIHLMGEGNIGKAHESANFLGDII